MLSKILKYEMKAVFKPMLILNALTLLSTLIGFFYVANLDVEGILHSNDNESAGMMLILGFLYIVGLAIVSLVSYLVLLIRYGKTMFGSNGYLSWTLPVKRSTLINGKILNGLIWNLINTTITMGCFCWLLCFYVAKAGVKFHDLIVGIPTEITWHFILPTMGMVVLSVISAVFVGYFCITVGQLLKEHKVLGTIIAFVGVYIVQQVATTLVMVGGGFFTYMNGDSEVYFRASATSVGIGAGDFRIVDIMMAGQALVTIVIALIAFTACHMIPRKKLNLD